MWYSMKNYLFSLLIFLIAQPLFAQPPVGYGSDPVWQDEFNDEKLNQSRWFTYDLPNYKGTRNSGLFPEQVGVIDAEGEGVLQLTANFNAEGYLQTGGIGTANLPMSGQPAEAKFETTYGYFEVKVKFPKANGLSFAFWLQSYGTHTLGNEGNDGMEIDIIETPDIGSGVAKVHHNLHWDGYDKDHVHVGKSFPVEEILDGAWHTVGLAWEPDHYRFYVDGAMTWETNGGGVSDVPQFILLTLDAGWVDYPPGPEKLPDQAWVDYIRVYKKE